MKLRWLVVICGLIWATLGINTVSRAVAYPRLETSFQVIGLTTDPFDHTQTDVKVRFQRVGARGSQQTAPLVTTVPAFFDGGMLWRARYTPEMAGTYRVASIILNGKVLQVNPQPSQWTVAGQVQPDFIRVSPLNHTRLAYENGTPYFPLGHNQAWKSNDIADIPALFYKMGSAGENWSRVWVVHWGNTNLDWPKPGPFGTLNLEVARRWDSIVEAAERNGIAFQMTLQHHGQYSTHVNPNWDENPYNVKNGGFLNTPNEFFTNAQAKALTKRKLRYTVARWGYSPAILAWELFNEVQFTDAANDKQWDTIAAWHREMAAFLREQDPYHHLITTSSTESIPASVTADMDYFQEHAYPSDLLTALHGDTPRTDKPYFVGEFGPSNLADAQGIYLHAGLWAGSMSGQAGAPQYWSWDIIEKNDLYSHFRAASAFVRASGLAKKSNLRRSIPPVTTPVFTDLSFGPGAGWATAPQSDFTVTSDGPPQGISTLPQFLQGTGHREMNPAPLTFKVHYSQPGRFTVSLNKVAASGAHVVLRLAEQVVERDFAAAAKDYDPTPEQRDLTLQVPAGAHTITLENTGRDWVVISRFTLSDYAPALTSYALNADDYAVAWVYHRGNIVADQGSLTPAVTGTLALTGLKAGRYHATWWDTGAGRALQTINVVVPARGALQLKTPLVTRDVALFVAR